ncbi:MAG: aminoglycoside phosphotransferase family protein [Paracoccaceae bacterium]|nr:aminoglycoside phosphotransferase family protein [Paracoccaceae bacterium]
MADQKVTTDEINQVCLSLLGETPVEIRFPGGQDRKTVIVALKDREVVVSKRASITRAKLEARVIRALHPSGYVPELLGVKGKFVLQSMIEGGRLTAAMENAPLDGRKALLMAAGQSLLSFQKLGADAGLTNLAPQIGEREGWMFDYAQTPYRLAGLVDYTVEHYDAEAIATRLKAKERAFVKWDARPGNALLDESGRVVWIDWEHCGVGSAEDDLVWLLADEWSPISEEAEGSLLETLSAMSDLTPDETAFRFHAKAVLHSMIRLQLIFRRKGDGGWWNVRQSMEHDRVGVSRAHVRRVVTRAKRWALIYPELQMLAGLLEATESYAESL